MSAISYQLPLVLGGLFILGLVADLLGRHTPIPRVTLLLVCGFLIGPSVLDLLPKFTQQWFTVLTEIALAMIGFLLGQNLTFNKLKQLGKRVLTLSVNEVLFTALLVFLGLWWLGAPVELAILLAAIAPATAPAASVDVVREINAKGDFTDSLMGIVAIDDVWGLLLFSILLAAVPWIAGNGADLSAIYLGLLEIVGAITLGLAIGFPAAIVTGRIQPGEPTQAEALGVVLLAAGLAIWMGVSYLLTAMTLGVVIANFARHHDRPFMAIEGIEWPFIILFFLLAGAALHLDALAQAGIIGTAYILLRVLGRILGIYVGARIIGTTAAIRRYMGLALLPQAGVAIGMALVVAQRYPALGEVLLPIILGSTVIFELLGPVAARWALRKAGNA